MNVLFALMMAGVMLFSGVSQFKAPRSGALAEGPGELVPAAEPVPDAAVEPMAEASETPAEEAVAAPVEEEPGVPTFAVFLPERIERVWYWYAYTEETQHIVQSAVEKALINAGLAVVDVASMPLPEQGDLAQVMSAPQVVRWGAAARADYIIMGTATADPQSESVAYGQKVVRSTANLSARIIRVSDSRIVAVQDASALMGGQALAAAAREALKKGGEDIGRKLARSAKNLPKP
ncbi:MAG TPA: hypothetical protein P5567_00950 [Kiritimatiellia bacterium]|nr:hypothetical protein [Kiritimatiellia bacterium]HRZ11001.1 hypothetical protein [Kiritimatiellia bacterium]HSA18574.1 hypothetical protein [Kiritimatiellia bacterium]